MKKFAFLRAVPVWAAGQELTMNQELAFRCTLSENRGGELRIAASSIYRIWVNGTFFAAGPARAAHGYYRVDRWDLQPVLCSETNVIVIEVVGFNVNSYDTLDQPAFLTAEVVCRDTGDILAATGEDSVQAFDLGQRIQRVQRYSFQRAFAEAYRLKAEQAGFYRGDAYDRRITLAPQREKAYLEREVPKPDFQTLPVETLLHTGVTAFSPCQNPLRDRAVTDIGPMLKGYALEELELVLSDEAQSIRCVPEAYGEETGRYPYLQNGYALYRFPYNATGLLSVKVICTKPTTLYLTFDEILTNEDVDCLRLTNCNCFRYELDPGAHQITTFAAYTMKYLKVVCFGACQLESIALLEYQNPISEQSVSLPAQEDLQKIYLAALRTYRSNALDIFMDCPSRERAGWLCDSFFTARVEYALTGKAVLERAYLENFLLAERFDHLPEGMLPMCYPADHYDGNFIPNWAMWFVLELEEYYQRTTDAVLVAQAKPRVYGLLAYFARFENEYGLLEKLEKWVFVEWSRANDLDVVQDVNFPSNMLYERMLRAVAKLYQDEALLEKAEALRKTIRDRSFNGSFFTDNECRTENGYLNPGNTTEACQYYAFFTGIATREEDSALWDCLVKDFGPKRKQTGLHPEVAFANAFIGNYLRIELLYRAGMYEAVLENIRGYFIGMAEQTGTLWEHDNTTASCNHGFASHVIYWLERMQLLQSSGAYDKSEN